MADRPRISLLAALDRKGGIGLEGALPWHLPEDLKHFKSLTMGHPIVMGRRTHESIGRALPGRRNLVVSRNPGYAPAQGCETFPSLEAALAACAREKEVFVIGGAQLYIHALPLADRLHFTEIDAEFRADTHFPAFERNEWREVSRETRTSPAGWSFAFVVYDRAG